MQINSGSVLLPTRSNLKGKRPGIEVVNVTPLVLLQVPQALDTPALPIPAQSSNSPAKPDTSALKDLKADIESAIQDALRNAVSKGSEKTKPSPSVHVDGERAKPQATVAAPEQAGSGSGVQSPSHSTHGSVSVEDAVTGEDGSGSGLKPDSP